MLQGFSTFTCARITLAREESSGRGVGALRPRCGLLVPAVLLKQAGQLGMDH